MPIKITTRGYIEVWRGTVKVSQHSIETEALEKATADAEASGSVLYTLKYPNKDLDLSRLTRVVRDLDVTRPTTPAGLVATPVSETQINLSWGTSTDPQGTPSEAISGLAGYRLYRNGSLRIQQAGTTFSDTGLSAFTAYSYAVSAYDNSGNESAQSSAVVATTPDLNAPTAPVIAATATSTSAISVALTTPSTDVQSGIASYTLQRATDAGFTANLVTTNAIAAASFPLSISTLSASTQYFFRLRAVDAASNVGAFSATVNATTQAVSNPTPGQTFELAVEGSGTQWTSFGHLFRAGAVTSKPVLQTLAGGAVTHQAHVHTLHPDGSVRFAEISAQVTGGQNYLVVNGTAPVGTARTIADLLAAIPGDIASVALTGGITGTAKVRDLLENATNRARLNNTSSYYIFEQGPQMLGVVVAQDFSTHLRVSMHLRWYGGAIVWCAWHYENGYVNLAGMNSKSYTAVMVLNGTTVATQAMTSPVHYNRTQWYSGGKWSTGGTLYARLQGATWTGSKGVPNYSLATPPSESYKAGRAQSFPPMNNGDFNSDLDSSAEQDMLGILSRWDAAYITSNCDVRMRNNVLANALCGMAYNYSCIMDSLTGEHLSVSDRPTFSSQQAATLPSGWNTGTSPYDAGVTGTFPAHMPSVAYLAFAITGEYGYMRAMHAWASFTPHYSDTNRNFTFNGKTLRRFYWDSSRGVGWSYRTVGQAAYITPDNHYLKLYYNNEVNGVFGVDAAEFNSSYSPIGLIESYEITSSGDHPELYRNFMHNFLSQDVSHVVCDLGFTSGQAFAAHVAKFVAGLMGNTNEFKWNFAASYTKKIGTTSAQANWFTTFTQMTNDTENVPAYATGLAAGSQALATAMKNAGDIPNAIAGSITGRPNEGGSYYANMQPAVSFLTALGITGGDACWTRYISGQVPDYSDKPQFNITPRPVIPNTVLAQYAALLNAGQCIKLPITISAAQIMDGNSPIMKWASSCCWNPLTGEVLFVGKREDAGHGYKFFRYIESSNTCDLVAFPPDSGNQSGHGYDHNAIDEARGKFFTRLYNDDSGPWQRLSGSWTHLPALGGQATDASSLTFIPTIGAQGSLCTVDPLRIRALDMATQNWSVLKTFAGPEANHSVSEYNRTSNILIFGGGNNGAAMQKMDCSTLVVSNINTPPFNCGTSDTQGVLCEDPASVNMIACQKGTSNWAVLNTSTGVWTNLTQSSGNGATAQNGLPNITVGSGDAGFARIATPISTYRVTLWIEYVGGNAGAIWLYKHTA